MAWRSSREDEIDPDDIRLRKEGVEGEPDTEEEEDEDEDYELSPGDPDYDLSEAAGHSQWRPEGRSSPIPQWLIIAVSLLLILAVFLPVILQFG